MSIQRQCDLTGLPRSSYYRESHGGQESRKNLEIMRLIDEEYTGTHFMAVARCAIICIARDIILTVNEFRGSCVKWAFNQLSQARNQQVAS